MIKYNDTKLSPYKLAKQIVFEYGANAEDMGLSEFTSLDYDAMTAKEKVITRNHINHQIDRVQKFLSAE